MLVRKLVPSLVAALSAQAAAQSPSTVYRYVDNAHPGVGASVRGVGDLNGDGEREVAVASYNVSCGFAGCLPASSRIAVLSGASGDVLYTITPPLNADAGAALDTLDDIDGDGVRELVVGVPYLGGLFNPIGGMKLYSGADGAELLTIFGPAPFSFVGQSVAGLDDFDGDGRADVAATDWNSVRLYSSASGAELFALTSPLQSPSQSVVARYSDWDQDGRDDFLVGFTSSSAQESGVVQIRSGASGALLLAIAPAVPEPSFGWDVRAAGDLDADGRVDIVVGAPQVDLGFGAGFGFAQAYSATGALLHHFVGASPNAHLGFVVAGGADVNGDTRPDLVIASSCGLSTANCARQALVFDGVSGASLATVDAPFVGSGGVSLDLVGDLNGDGRSEVGFGSACSEWFASCGVATLFSVSSSVVSTYCTPGVSSNGCSASMLASGVASASATSGFTIAATQVEGQRQSLCFYGVSGRTGLPWGSTGSFLCVKPPVQRTVLLNSGGVLGQCNGAVQFDWLVFLGATPGALGAPFQVGDVVNSQVWYRDPPSSNGTQLSNALEFTLVP